MGRRIGLLLGAAVILILAVAASLAIGARPIPLDEVWAALFHPNGSETAVIVHDLRIPRTVVGLAVGPALAVAGLVMQALTRNPLAEPRILGISAGASTGVVLAIAVFGIGTLAGWIWFALLGALAAGAVVFTLGLRLGTGSSSPITLALTGAAVDACLGAVIYTLLSTSTRTFDQFRFWAVGSLSGRSLDLVVQAAPILLLGLVSAIAAARGLDGLALGDEVAVGLGHRIALVRTTAAIAAVTLTGAAVALAGPIAFVGLAVPHAARALSARFGTGTSHALLLPLSALLGGVLVLVADTVGRIIAPPGEIPAGVLTALVGAPLLVALTRRPRLVAA
ncbi:MAG: iron ABC transporter permease [Hamadaea sp.]|uniref:FecCD family ABC transporter permease n=1 Tax=Hamadaea sp. TaxID=2024425 RepID=UPI0017A81390|nr:iron ABC transporter permease [Hamadaea sp.]NUR72889.1 iron ABC transporter permease [Hamadaea sp.]NUT22173.1 iron ABC transporter permease [Hamadaea sp.]